MDLPEVPVTRRDARALVLAGGGAAGNAWALGVVAGLADAGLDVTGADLVVGTSSGSTATAQITSGRSPADLFAAVLAEAAPSAPVAGRPRPPVTAGQDYLDWSQRIIDTARNAADMRRRMGAAAMEMDASDGAAAQRWRQIVAARLPGDGWPEQRILIAAVDADTGEPVVFDRRSGVDLVDAVAASTSSGFAPTGPYRIGERRFINGGYRRNENADLAAGYGRVLVLSPFGGRSRMPAQWGMDLATQVAELRAGGSTVETVFPGPDVAALFDANALDPATRLPAARSGFEQGRALADRLGGGWR